MAYKKLNKPYTWVDAEDAKITLLDAEKLNEKEKTLNDIDDRLVDVGNALEELKSETSEAAEDLSTAISDVEKKVSKVEDKAGENYELIYSLREEVREDIENLQEADAEIKKSIASISTDLALTSSPKAPAITEKVIGNPVCVKDTADGYANVKVRGKYEQDSIPGAQLLDLTTALRNSNASATYNEPALTVVKNFATSSAKVVYKIAEVEKLTGQTIYLKCGYTGNGGKVELGYCNDTASSASIPATLEVGEGENAELSLEVSQPTDTSKIYVYAAFYPDTSKAGSKGDVGVFTDVMVSTTPSATWEPYTGGAAAPNPNYPMPIKGVKGKNEMDGRGLTEQVNAGITYTPVYDKNGNLLYVEANGTSTAVSIYRWSQAYRVGKYILSSGLPSGTSNEIFAGLYYTPSSAYKVWAYANDEGEFELTEDTVLGNTLRVGSGLTVEGLKFYPMVRPASVLDDSYVPYGCLQFKTKNKNMLGELEVGFINTSGADQSGESARRTKFIPVEFGKSYTFQKAYAFITTTSNGMARLYDADKNHIGNQSVLGYAKTNQTVTFAENVKYIRFVQGTATDDSVDWDTINLQMEEGEVATEYEPYTESVATLSNPIELGGLNGIEDTVDAEKIVRRFIEVVFDGSDDEGWTASSVVSGRYMTKNYAQITPMSRGLCTQALFGGDNNAELNKFYISSSSQFIINTEFATLSEWKAHLAANPMIAVLRLATPTTEALPTADQIALNGLKSFDGVTYVETDSEVKPTLDVECVLDTKRYIDRKIAEVAAAIIG